MKKLKGLLDLEGNNSLIGQVFDHEIDLNDFNINPISIPGAFKDFSFVPGKKGFSLIEYAEKFENYLNSLNVASTQISPLVSGVMEAIKNAYEHGNIKDNSKKIFWHNYLSKEKVFESIVGDVGGKINGNFFSYSLNLREKKKTNINDAIGFYQFINQTFSPYGHSGVGLKDIHKSFDSVRYFKNKFGGLSLYMKRNL